MLQDELVEPTACPLSPAGTADLTKGKVLALLIVFSMFSDLQSLINTEYRTYPEKKICLSALLPPSNCCQIIPITLPVISCHSSPFYIFFIASLSCFLFPCSTLPPGLINGVLLLLQRLPADSGD